MFKSATALRNYVAQTTGIDTSALEYITLSRDEKMLVEKANPTKPLGYASFAYQGIVPGRGKVWDIDARPA